MAERYNHIIIEKARTMLADANLPIRYWAEAISTAICSTDHRQKLLGEFS